MACKQGSASLISMAMVVAMALVLQSGTTLAATYVVGDNAGWTYNVTNWTYGKLFRVGDTLVFNYNPLLHNVVEVDEGGYSRCLPTTGSKFYFSGNDHIKLAKGPKYFICSFPGHCEAGMKIAVSAIAA